jgi:hypothetical protein
MLTQVLLRTCTWSWWMYDWQLERKVAQHRMQWKMMEEERLWEEERIVARIVVMLMGMGMGMDMGMDNADAVMQCQQDGDRMMQEPSSDEGGSGVSNNIYYDVADGCWGGTLTTIIMDKESMVRETFPPPFFCKLLSSLMLAWSPLGFTR